MAPKRSAAVRKGTRSSGRSANSRRNPSRNTGSPSSAPASMRVTKPRDRPDSLQATIGPRVSTRSTTRSQPRPQYRIESSDEEPLMDIDDDESFEESTQRSSLTSRRHAHPAISTGAPGANTSDTENNEDPIIKHDEVASARDVGKPGRKRGRPRKCRELASDDEHSCRGAAGGESGDDLAPTTSTTKSRAPKRRPGRPSAKEIDSNTSKDHGSIIPDWMDPRMEHAIWTQVFRYAAVSGDEDDIMDVNWLLQASRICRNLLDPALTVLYRRPPIKDETKAQGLVELLEKPPSMTAINYRVKIESLHIDVRLVSLQGYTSPIRMMRTLPRLSEVLLLHGYDQPPYRKLRESIKWTYPSDLWQAFEASTTSSTIAGVEASVTRLQSWQWSSRLMDKNWETGLVRMKEVHQMSSFATLRKLKLINYQLPSVRLEKDPDGDPELLAEDERSVKLITEALSALGHLEDLAFESSTIVCTLLLPLLPANLKRLELVNCAEVNADNLATFLLSHGHQLESLVLNHNRSLSLAFLTMIGNACSHLKELHANFKYFSLLETVDDNDPFYDHLLLPEQVPHWPQSLEVVHLENLRQWNMEAAEVFLQSFIDSAPELPNLRHMSIKAMLDIPWRSRSGFRKLWQERFEKVFLRRSKDPEPNFSLRKQPKEPSESATTKRRPRRTPVEPTRRSNRVLPSSRGSGISKELRGKRQKPQSYREPDSDEFDSDSEVELEDSERGDAEGDSDQDAKDGVESAATFIQGLCTVVDINIDNQKPREYQYSMDDFLNEERDFETDDEWDGD